jgi:hypothetical protein
MGSINNSPQARFFTRQNFHKEHSVWNLRLPDLLEKGAQRSNAPDEL